MRSQTARLGPLAVLVAALLMFFAGGCGSDRLAQPDPSPPPTPVSPTSVPASTPEVTATPAPGPTPTASSVSPPSGPGDAGGIVQFDFAVAVPRVGGDQVPVFDEPGGPPRTLADVNAIDQITQPNPLLAQTQ